MILWVILKLDKVRDEFGFIVDFILIKSIFILFDFDFVLK